ncbi:MaoC family dehydratase [Lacinutrix chionoecetis]
MAKFTEKIKVGTTYTSESFSYTQKNVNDFAEISGDRNPLHLDEDYASKTIFKKRIIHGYLGSSIFSKVFATDFPGEGTIYLKQDLKFLRPMFVEVNYTAKFSVLELDTVKHRALVKTEIFNSENEITVSGEALIQNKSYL